MKILAVLMFLIIGLFFVSNNVFSQSEEAFEKYLILRNNHIRKMSNSGFWSISLSGGAVTYHGENNQPFRGNISKWLSPYGKLTVSRWINSVWGVRLQVNGGYMKNEYTRIKNPESEGQMYFVDSYIGVVTNVMNWGSYKRLQRPVSLYLYGEGGMAWTPARHSIPEQWAPAALIGARLNIRLTDHWSVLFDIDRTFIDDKFNGSSDNHKCEGYTAVASGLSYRIK